MSGPLPVRHTIADLTRLLVRSERLAELLPQLHVGAIEAAGGQRSVLLQRHAPDGGLRPTSAFGLDRATDEWAFTPAESARVDRVFEGARPVVIANLREALPSLASRLDAPSALVVPLQTSQRRIGILVVARDPAPLSPAASEVVAAIGDLFVIALERAQMLRAAELQRDLGNMFELFAGTASSAMTLTAGLEAFCSSANRLFAAERTSVWIHDRRAHQVVLEAASDPEYLAERHRVPTSDSLVPAAIGLRRDGAAIVGRARADGTESILAVPLRGRRRALGTLVFEGVRLDTGSRAELLDRADEVSRQLSFAIENVQLLEDVLRSHREIENTFNSIADLVAVFDDNLRLIHVNDAFVERVGRSRDEILDRPLTDFVSAETGRWIRGLTLAAPSTLDEANAASMEIEDEVLQGTFSITVTALVGPDHTPIGRVIVARDVTHQARLEAEQIDLRDRLSQSEKLAALGQFVAGIAHELNNPLQAVLGHLELLRATGAFPKALRRDVQVVYREADRAAKIVRNLLVFAGSRRLARRRISINAVVTRALAFRSASCRDAGIELVRDHDEALPRLQAAPLLLQQAVLNILINAEHAVEGQPLRRITTQTSADARRERIVVRIHDTGPGLAPDILPRVFEPFFTTKEVGKGTGLGLAIAYGIIQEHGGQISAGNHPGGGAIFTIELPVRAPRSERAPA